MNKGLKIISTVIIGGILFFVTKTGLIRADAAETNFEGTGIKISHSTPSNKEDKESGVSSETIERELEAKISASDVNPNLPIYGTFKTSFKNKKIDSNEHELGHERTVERGIGVGVEKDFSLGKVVDDELLLRLFGGVEYQYGESIINYDSLSNTIKNEKYIPQIGAGLSWANMYFQVLGHLDSEYKSKFEDKVSRKNRFSGIEGEFGVDYRSLLAKLLLGYTKDTHKMFDETWTTGKRTYKLNIEGPSNSDVRFGAEFEHNRTTPGKQDETIFRAYINVRPDLGKYLNKQQKTVPKTGKR